MAREHVDAISRVDDLITMVPFDHPGCYTAQVRVRRAATPIVSDVSTKAYMYLLLGSARMESNDHESAIHSFGACSSSNTTLWEQIAFSDFTGDLHVNIANPR